MRGRTAITVLVAAFAVSNSFAARHIGFETDAFNRAYPASYTKSFVFSPASFEIDCAMIAESLDTIPKANVSSMMGVVLDFPSEYKPILEAFAMQTNGFDMIAARGFCVQDIAKADPTFRLRMQQDYGVEVLRAFPKEGAEAWFKAAMDGEMEDFATIVDTSTAERYYYYDLVSFSAAWEEPFPTDNTRSLPFKVANSSNTVGVVCMSDVRVADIFEAKEYTLLKLPLKGGASFFAIMPKDGYGLADARADMTSLEIDMLLASTKAVAGSGSYHGPCAIVLPRLEMTSSTDFGGVLRYFRIPTTGLHLVAGEASGKTFAQHVKFSLLENGRWEKPLRKKSEDDVIPITKDVRKAIFTKPFIFFVYHEETATMPIAGQFTGVEL